jgi:hypothetical protein
MVNRPPGSEGLQFQAVSEFSRTMIDRSGYEGDGFGGDGRSVRPPQTSR